jgi:CRP-like cAMP-binding protein
MNTALDPALKAKIIGIFQQNEIFSKLSPSELDQLIAIANIREFQQDEIVFTEDQQAQYLFLVARGSFILQLKSNRIKVFKPGEIFGEIGIINNAVRTGGVRANEPAAAVVIPGDKIFNEEYVDAKLSLKIIRALAKKITTYLRSKEQISTMELIKGGENHYVEFKSSLRMNRGTGKKDKAVELGILKTVAGFFNTQGGTMIVGVGDEGVILGLEDDQFPSFDKLVLHLIYLVKMRISPLHMDFIHFDLLELEGKNVLRVDCEAATTPAYVRDGSQEYFFIRTGPSTTNLKISQVYDYIAKRFHNAN